MPAPVSPRRSALLSAALLPLLLTACQGAPRPPEAHDLSGTIGGNWPSATPNIRLALVGTGFPQALTNESQLPQRVEARSAGGWHYGVDLSAVPSAAGIYQVVAFDDRDGDAKYDLGEEFARNRQYLIFSLAPGQFNGFSGSGLSLPPMTLAQGWNIYNAAQPVSAANPRAIGSAGEKGYDLTR